MAGSGAERAFAEFVTARYARLVRTGYLLTADRGHAEDLLSPRSVWTGGALLSVNQVGKAAVWDPAADAWTRLPDAPVKIDEAVFDGSTIWTGQQVLLWGGTGRR